MALFRDDTPLATRIVAVSVGGISVIALVVSLLSGADDSTASPRAAVASQPPLDTTPGITRVGAARAAEFWRQMPTTPGVRRWSCAEELCTVEFTPAMWYQMEHNLRRDVTAMLGIAFAYGQQARWTEIRDVMSNRRLARYATRSDNATVY